MGNLNENFIIAIVILLGALLFTARLIAIKTNHDPIMNRYKAGTSEHNVYKRFLGSHRFPITLAISELLIPISTAYVVYAARRLIHMNTPSAHYMLIFGPIASIILYVVICWILYYVLIG